MTDKDFQITCLALTDQQRLIAAGKFQRWDVTKWTMAVNLALATASISVGKAAFLFFVFSIVAAIGGWALVYHYNKRITGARADAETLKSYLRDGGIDPKLIPEETRVVTAPQLYDLEERYIFGYIIGASILPSLMAAAF